MSLFHKCILCCMSTTCRYVQYLIILQPRSHPSSEHHAFEAVVYAPQITWRHETQTLFQALPYLFLMQGSQAFFYPPKLPDVLCIGRFHRQCPACFLLRPISLFTCYVQRMTAHQVYISDGSRHVWQTNNSICFSLVAHFPF